MSFDLINNDNQQQLGIVFNVPKKNNYSKVRFNEILIQKTKSDISYNNNCIRFLRKGVDYLNRPLKYIYDGNYDANHYYYLLNQFFIPPFINYNNIQDYCDQINKIIENSIIESSINLNINMYLYSKSILNPIYQSKDPSENSKQIIQKRDNIYEPEEKKLGIALYRQTTNFQISLDFYTFENKNYNLAEFLSNNLDYYQIQYEIKPSYSSGIAIFDVDYPINLIENFQFLFNNYSSGKYEATYTLMKSNFIYNTSDFLNENSINVYDLDRQYDKIFYPKVLGSFKQVINKCYFIVYEIIKRNNQKYYMSLNNNLQDILMNNEYFIVKINRYETYPVNENGPFTFVESTVDSVIIKDDSSISTYALSKNNTIDSNYINNEITFDYTPLLDQFNEEIYNPESENNNIIIDPDESEGEIIGYNLIYEYAMVTDYYPNTKINNLNNDITNINIRLKCENKHEYYEKQKHTGFKKINKYFNEYQHYNINGVAGNFVYQVVNSDDTITQNQIIPNKYYKVLFGQSLNGNLFLNAYDIIIWINVDETRINEYSVITENGGQKYFYQLRQGDQLLCIKNFGNLESQIIIELTNFEEVSTATEVGIIKPLYLEFEFIPVLNENSEIEPNNYYNNSEVVWFLNFQITFINALNNSYVDELDILIDDLEEYIESLNGNTIVKFRNKDLEITVDINSLIYKIEEIPFIPNADKFYGESVMISNNEKVKYKTNNEKNMKVFTQYIISGFIINVSNIESTNESKSIDYKNNIIRYKHWYSTNNDNTVYDNETYFMIGDLTYQFIESKELYTANATNPYINKLYETNNIINKLPNIKIQYLKLHKLLEDELFFNYFKTKRLIEYSNDNTLKFNIEVIPVEFSDNINNHSLNDIHNLSKTKNGIDIKTTLNMMPNILQRSQQREFNFNNNIDKYIYDLANTDKFYTLFGQFSKSLWEKIGIIPNKLEYKNLLYNYDSNEIRCYNYIGSNMTQELYNNDYLDLNTNILRYKLQLSHEEILYNPTKKHIYDGIMKKFDEFDIVLSDLEIILPKKDFKLYEHGKYIIDNQFNLNIQSDTNFNDSLYTIKLSYSENIDDIINNNLNPNEIEKNTINIKEHEKYYSFDLTYNNIIYSFENENSIYLYIDSQYHYPFLSGTNALLKVEYIN